MTTKDLVHKISRKTGIPSNVVAHILDCQNQIISECLIRQEDVVLKSVCRITSNMRKQNRSDPKTGDRVEEFALRLGVRPTKEFRKELNRWTNTA